jgi:uncharacterized protein (UPF0335 family)
MSETEVGGINTDRLRSYVERIEHLLEEIKELQADVKDIKIEAKSAGYIPKAIMAIIKLRSMNTSDRDYQEAVLDTYRRALNL